LKSLTAPYTLLCTLPSHQHPSNTFPSPIESVTVTAAYLCTYAKRDLAFLSPDANEPDKINYFNNVRNIRCDDGFQGSFLAFINRPKLHHFPNIESFDIRLFDLSRSYNSNNENEYNVRMMYKVIEACKSCGPKLKSVSGFIFAVSDMQMVMDAVLSPSNGPILTAHALEVLANSKDLSGMNIIAAADLGASWSGMDMIRVLKVFGRFQNLLPSILTRARNTSPQLPQVVDFVLETLQPGVEALVELLSMVVAVFSLAKFRTEELQERQGEQWMLKILSAINVKRHNSLESNQAEIVTRMNNLLNNYLIYTIHRSPQVISSFLTEFSRLSPV
jgi:hypothetical protein